LNEWLIFFYLSQTVKLSLTASFEVFSSQNSSSSGKFLDGKKKGKNGATAFVRNDICSKTFSLRKLQQAVIGIHLREHGKHSYTN